jgi:DNA polymerase elongation subunit (family B)
MSHNFILGPVDTDSISFRKPDGAPFTEEEQELLLEEINELMPNMIEYEHDGYYEKIIVLKAKNYILKKYGEDKVSLKGSSLKDQKKEPALREMMDKLIKDLIDTDGQNLVDIYHSYILEVMNIKDISRWCTKKTVSKAILDPERSNEQKVADAIQGLEVREGDKIYIYSAVDGQIPETKGVTSNWHTPLTKDLKPKMVDNSILRTRENFRNDVDVPHYLKRVHSTVKILENVVDIKQFVAYHNSGSKKKLEELCTKLEI